MYNNSTQYPSSGYQNVYPQYQQNYDAGYGYQGYTYQNAQLVPPGDTYPQTNWTSTGYSDTSHQNDEKSNAVAQEMQQQKAQLVKQREDYVKKASVLRHELEQLRNQKQDLLSDGSSDRDLVLILKENDKLQDEIQGKMKAIYNVIEMLSSIIKDGKRVSDLEASIEEQPPTPKSIVKEIHRSPTPAGEDESGKRYCYIYYDSGLHWCRACDEFPETAKGLLQHLQSTKHQEMAKENEVDTTPWHKLPLEPVLPTYDDAPKKRIPIKGLQFFISAPSWYCKLCDIWIGDLHCASHHLKSQAHFQNYENFIQQNPHWETEWLKDREKAMTRNGKPDSSDDETSSKKKKKHKHHKSLESILSKEKKRKKRSKKRRKHSSDSSSSSSSSDSSSEDEKSDRTRSIRVAMRNMSKVQSIMNEDMSKWSVLEKLLEDHKKRDNVKEKVKEPEDDLINQWMTVSEPQDKEKHLLDSLKDRMRARQEVEKAKFAEMEKRKKEKEIEEQEMMERKEREAREEIERIERERQRREQEEFQRITDKDRSHVKFRTTRDNYRKRRSPSKSEEEEEEHHDNRYRESPHSRYRRDSERSAKSREKSKSRSRSIDRKSEESSKKKPPGPPSYKKLPFIGRMPLFKNKKMEEKPVEKEIKKEEYEPQRRTRFEPGNLPRAFIPQPDVVCFPRLSSIPPLMTPPPPAVIKEPVVTPKPPEPPKISEMKKEKSPPAPPPPQIRELEKHNPNNINEDNLYSEHGPEMDPNMMGQYYQDYNNMMYSQMYDFPQEENTDAGEIPHSHTMPLEPPPLPPDDDLALLGICADDMAAQSF